MNHNKKLDNLIKTVRKKAYQAENNHELLDSVQLIKDFNGEIKYHFGFHIFFFMLGLMTIAVNIYYVETNVRYADIEDYIFSFIGGLVSCIAGGIMIWKSSDISALSQYIYQKDTLQDNKLSSLSIEDSLFSYLSNNFKKEFSRGNHKRYFEKAFSSRRSVFRDYEFQLFQFHYVNKRQVPVTTTVNGKTTTTIKTVYDHYNRYGFVMDFEYFKNIEVKNSGSILNSQNYETASIEFDKTFNVGSTDIMNLSKFLSPVVVEAFINLSKELEDLNVEIDSNGKLCITCKDSSLFVSESTRKYGIEEPEEFFDELSGFTVLNKLEAIFEFMFTLNKEHD